MTRLAHALALAVLCPLAVLLGYAAGAAHERAQPVPAPLVHTIDPAE